MTRATTPSPAVDIIWTVPTWPERRRGGAPVRGGHAVGSPRDGRTTTDLRVGSYTPQSSIAQVARAAAVAGFDGVFFPLDAEGVEPSVVAASVARSVGDLKVITALDPALSTPVYAAKMAATFQRFSGGRLGWRVAIDGPVLPGVAAGPSAAAGRARAEEFLDVVRGVFTGGSFDHLGANFEVRGGGFDVPLSNAPVPTISSAGVDEDALIFASRYSDIHVLPALEVADFTHVAHRLQQLAAGAYRTVRIGIEAGVVARIEAIDAWEWVDTLGGLAAASTDAPVARGAWNRAADATVLVGSYGDVAARLDAYANAGASAFVLSGSPALEEAYRFGQHVRPLLRSRPPRESAAAATAATEASAASAASAAGAAA